MGRQRNSFSNANLDVLSAEKGEPALQLDRVHALAHVGAVEHAVIPEEILRVTPARNDCGSARWVDLDETSREAPLIPPLFCSARQPPFPTTSSDSRLEIQGMQGVAVPRQGGVGHLLQAAKEGVDFLHAFAKRLLHRSGLEDLVPARVASQGVHWSFFFVGRT